MIPIKASPRSQAHWLDSRTDQHTTKTIQYDCLADQRTDKKIKHETLQCIKTIAETVVNSTVVARFDFLVT